MNLIADDKFTDKNTSHSYLPLYDTLLTPMRETALNVLEIGVQHGGSIDMWERFFPNAVIHGADIRDRRRVALEQGSDGRVRFHLGDAYQKAFAADHFPDTLFDFVLDDGPHTRKSMLSCIDLYLPLVKTGGVFAIEDVQRSSWIRELTQRVPEDLRQYVKVYDRRKIKGRYDDIVFTVEVP